MSAVASQNCQSPNAGLQTPKKVTVSTGEVCTIQTAVQYGIFDKGSIIQSNVKEAAQIDTLQGNTYDASSQYSLCKINNSGISAVQNCVLSTRNPWKTLNDTEQFCTLPYNVELPNGLKYIANSQTTIEKPENIPKWKSKRKCLQERWYDWFSIPDYHLGNKYDIDSSNLHYLKPCSIGFVPSSKTRDKCTSKTDFYDGEFDGTFNYTPLALIHLLGNTKDTLIAKYTNNMTNKLVKIRESKIGIVDPDIYEHITKNEDALSEIYNEIKRDIQPHIQLLMNQPFDDRNILEPHYNDNDLPEPIIKKDRVEDAYVLAYTFYDLYTSNISYNTDETEDAFDKWKKGVAEVSGYGINDSKFHKQLMTLKKACMISFDFQSEYSKILFSILNNGKSESDANKALKFGHISEDERLKAISNNISENPTIIDNADDTIMQRRNSLLDAEDEKISQLKEDKLELNKIEYDPIKYGDSVHEEALSNPLAENVTSAKSIVMIGVFIIMLLLFFGILYILGSILWEPLANLMNMIILGFYVGILKLKDTLFRGPYDPPSYDKDILKLQKDFLFKKITNDIKKYKLPVTAD